MTVVDQPHGGAAPYQRRPDRNDRKKESRYGKQEGSGYTRDEKAGQGHQRLRQRRPENAVYHSGHGVVDRFQHFLAEAAGNLVQRPAYRKYQGLAVTVKKEADKARQHQLQQTLACGLACANQKVTRGRHQAVPLRSQAFATGSEALPIVREHFSEHRNFPHPCGWLDGAATDDRFTRFEQSSYVIR